MHRLTKYTSIPKSVKQTVYNRDRCKCVMCGRFVPEYCASAHYIARSQLGLGIEQNIVTLCPECHGLYDNSVYRDQIRDRLREHLQFCYPGWDETKLVYRKDYDR